jgi:methylmalonyl-CoA/ethylmalonyl-CoA epimerase
MPADLAAAPLSQVALVVRNLPAATAFYRDVLGIPFMFAAPNLAFFNVGGVRLMLSPPEGEFTQPGSVLYFKVPDIQSTHAELTRRGVVFRDEPHIIAPMPAYDLWMTFFKDLDGNTLALMSEVPR